MEEEYVNTGEIRDNIGSMKVATDRKGQIFVASKNFSDNFVGTWMSNINILSIVHPDEVDKFKTIMHDFTGDTEKIIVKLKRIDGIYRYNLVFMNNNRTAKNDGYDLDIEVVDVESLIGINRRLESDKKQMRRLFGLTDDYTFSYDKNTNIIKLNYYRNDGHNEFHSMTLEQWNRYMMDNNYVEESEVANLKQIVYYLKHYNADFSVKLKTSLRTNGNMFEILQFIGVLYTDNLNTVIIGRIVPTGSTSRIRSVKILDELKYDSLSNVFNKKTITDYANRLVEQYACDLRPVTIAVIDIDNFKDINDTYGHLYGDKIITKFASKIKEIVGDDGYVGRIGGDEFVVVTNSINDEPSLRALLRSIRTQVKWEFSKETDGPHITCSIGAARLPDNGKSYEEIFRKADFCLYIAKEKGRDRYVFFRDDLHQSFYEDFANNKAENRGGKGREIQELKFVMNYMQQACRFPGQAFELAAMHMIKEFNIDSINIYAGKDMKKIKTIGIGLNDGDDAMYAKEDKFRVYLNGQNYVQIGFVGALYDEYPELYEILKERRVFSTIQCIVGDVNNPLGIVTFDKCKEAAQWAEYEVNVAVILACSAENFLKDYYK